MVKSCTDGYASSHVCHSSQVKLNYHIAAAVIEALTASNGAGERGRQEAVEIGNNVKWRQRIPFSKPWREQRKARKMHMALLSVGNSEETPKRATTLHQPSQHQFIPEVATEIQREPPALHRHVPTTTVLLDDQTQTNIAKDQKILAQYPHYDNKGAVGAARVSPSPDRPYPYREYVNGKRVLAQYGHHDNKWAVRHPVY